MRLVEMYKRVDRRTLVVVGHLSKAEIAEYKRQGYRLDAPQVNKNGIPVGRAV